MNLTDNIYFISEFENKILECLLEQKHPSDMRVFRYTYTGAVIFCVAGSFLSFTSFTVYKITQLKENGYMNRRNMGLWDHDSFAYFMKH